METDMSCDGACSDRKECVMRKRIVLLSMAILIMVVAGRIIADRAFSDADTEKYEDAFALAQAWAKEWELTHLYPDYVSGVWVEGETYVIGVTNDSAGYREGRKIKKQLKNKDSIRIVFQKYSYNELYHIVEELYPHMQEYSIVIAGVKASGNYVRIALKKGITEEKRKAATSELLKRYGKRIRIDDELSEECTYSIAED